MTVEMKRPVRRAQRQRRSRQLLQRHERESPGADLRGLEAYMYGHMIGCNIAERNAPDQISGLIQVKEIRRRGSARKQRNIHAWVPRRSFTRLACLLPVEHGLEGMSAILSEWLHVGPVLRCEYECLGWRSIRKEEMSTAAQCPS